jgi:hypothetical protein
MKNSLKKKTSFFNCIQSELNLDEKYYLFPSVFSLMWYVWYVWYGMVWYGMIWYGIVCMVWHDMVWYGMVCMVCML